MNKVARLIQHNRAFAGCLNSFEHDSQSCHCPMQFQVYFPPQTEKQKVPLLIWLGDHQQHPEDFMANSGVLRLASDYGIGIIALDTSPRNISIPFQQKGIGEGNSYYVDATQTP